MGIKKYKGYNIKKETNHDRKNKMNRNFNYIILLLILANLYFLPQYLGVASKTDKTVEELPVIDNSIIEEDNKEEARAYKVNFVSKGLDVLSNLKNTDMVDFQLSEEQLIIIFKDQEGNLLQDVGKIIESSSFFKIMDVDFEQDSNIRIRMARLDE